MLLSHALILGILGFELNLCEGLSAAGIVLFHSCWVLIELIVADSARLVMVALQLSVFCRLTKRHLNAK